MSTLVAILHIIVSIFLMLTVLLQSGKGGGMGAAFGGGNAATVFGGSGASTFLRRLTAVSGTIFMFTSLTLAWLASHNTADALEKFGKQQDELRAEKEKANTAAIDSTNKGSGSAGSGSAITPDKPNGVTPANGSDTKPDATKPGDATKPADGSAKPADVKPADATKPAEKPADKTPAEKPADKATPTKTDTKPADKATPPKTDTKPAEAPAPAPTP